MCSALCSGQYDVRNVSFRGDCTVFGMSVTGVYQADGAFLVTTTGARFEYAAGKLKIYQGLGSDIDRRLLATITIGDVNEFEKAESNSDHVLFWSEKANVGIYGDSTCIIAPKVDLDIRFTGNFKPDYEGRYEGELLLIDDLGGMEIYPQRYEAGYKIKKIKLGIKNWIAEYLLNAKERVMIAAFPARQFDWDKSFKSHIVNTTGAFEGCEMRYPFGTMPPDDTIKSWSKWFDILLIDHNGLYRDHWGPYIVVNQPEFRRLIATAHKCGMKVIAHCAMYYYFWKNENPTPEDFYSQVKAVYDKYGTDGIYIDGLCVDGEGHKIEDKILNWEMIRRFRKLVGKDGVIVVHDTSLGSPVGTRPNIDSYCDATLNGEGISFKSVNDTYIKYHVRKYGISNNIALWDRWRAQPDYITDKEVIDALLAMNGRQFWGAHAFWRRVNPDVNYRYYMERLALLEQAYRTQKSMD